eukprot:246608_1
MLELSINNERTQHEELAHYCSRTFTWLNTFILWIPMWSTKKQPNTPRRCYLNCIILPLVIAEFIFVIFYWMGNILFFNENILYNSGDINLFAIMHAIWAVIYLFARLISIVYFAVGFNFQWDTSPKYHNNISYNSVICKQYYHKVLNTNKRFKAFLCVEFLALYPMHFSVFFYYLIFEQKPKNLFIQYFGRFMELHVIFLPFAIASCCLSLILLKHQLQIYLLRDTMGEDVMYDQTYQKYKQIVNSFNNDIGMIICSKHVDIWQIYFCIQIFAYFCKAWTSAALFLHNESNIWQILHSTTALGFYVLPLIEIVIASNNLSNEFSLYIKELLKYSLKQHHHSNNITLNDLNTRVNQMDNYQILYRYSKENKLCFKIGGSDINTNNAMKVVLFFIITKCISYTVYNVDY